MAVVNLSITVADADVSRVLDAARATWNIPAATPAEAQERLRQEVIGMIRRMVSETERRVALDAANALDPQVTIS